MASSYAWFFYALTSAILWGYSYALSERVFREGLNVPFFMMVSGGIYFLFCIIFVILTNQFKEGFVTLSDNKPLIGTMVLVASCYVGGAFLAFLAISQKNATLANFVEMSYPFFTFLFAWALYKEVQLNWYALLGGILIFSGIGLIYLKS